MRSKVGLIAYADRFGGDLAGLRALLGGPLRGLFGGVHVLPFYRPYDGADAGFDPQDHTQVDPRLGTWEDVAALSAEYQVMADVIVNHMSSSAAQFQDWLAHGRASQFAGMFLTFNSVFPDGATEETLTRLYRPRPGLPFTPYVLADGSKALVWTTFTPQQIDIDVRHRATRSYLLHVLDQLAGAGVAQVRLDAVGYAVKTPGLTSFMTLETFEFIDEVTRWCHERNLEVLPREDQDDRRQPTFTHAGERLPECSVIKPFIDVGSGAIQLLTTALGRLLPGVDKLDPQTCCPVVSNLRPVSLSASLGLVTGDEAGRLGNRGGSMAGLGAGVLLPAGYLFAGPLA